MAGVFPPGADAWMIASRLSISETAGTVARLSRRTASTSAPGDAPALDHVAFQSDRPRRAAARTSSARPG